MTTSLKNLWELNVNKGGYKVYYKVLKNIDGKLISPFQRTEYKMGKEYFCEDFDDNLKKDCSRGFYATGIEGVLYSFRNLPTYEVYKCEVGGRIAEIDQFKRRYERIKLIEFVPNEEVKKLALAEETILGYKLAETLYPIHPFKIKAGKVTIKEIELLRQWYSVRKSVGYSVWDSVGSSVGKSVGYSVWYSVWNSVWDSVGYSVWDSVGNSVGAYISSLFPNIKKWKYIDHEEGINPFQPCIDLWRAGFVPSFDGKIWRLHAREKGEIVYQEDKK